MRPVGLLGVFTITIRVRAVMAAAIASTSRSWSIGMTGTFTGMPPAATTIAS